ncbi:MAG TPA: cupredoxin domain-containing protein [Anaerolineales bacterium]|nr:cupredoxin domain-containing protein [Anaerolineales bacterium]HNQ96148.1 cupredoxin domain-containing protein [Anaerolineales bacterium]HNS60861.1 cupredoxin domain-containing protein [Anaerolineales bacterium]
MPQKTIIILALAALLAGCGGTAQPTTEISLEASDFAYSTPSITVPAGQPVTLTMHNAGAVEHDFVIEKINVTDVQASDSGPAAHHQVGHAPEYDLHFFAKSGETETLEFTALEPGTYQIFCSVEGHKEAGMIGELIVVE